MIAENIAELKLRIAEAAERVQRNSNDIRIVAAAKGQGREKIEEALSAGISIIGHNYFQEAFYEMPLAGNSEVEFHMIGNLQKNKAGKAVELFHVIETVDNATLAGTLSRRAEAIGWTIGVMIQVNLAREPQKSGIEPEKIQELAEAIRSLPAVCLQGLMTIPPIFDDPVRARPYFAGLRELRDKLIMQGVLTREMKELSMGMTGDLEVAVEEGATLVRIGTGLFGSRS